MTEAASPADWDGPWKDAITALLRHFLLMFFPVAHDQVDWSRPFETLDKELQKIAPDSATGRRSVDLLFKLWLLSGEERWVLLHVEVQAQRDPNLPERIFVYHYRIRDYYNQPLASFVILADEEKGWRPGPYVYDLWGCGGEFHYPSVKLLDFARKEEELEQGRNPFAVVLLAHLKARETANDYAKRRIWKVRLLKGLYNRGWERGEVRELLKLIDWFLTLPREDERLVYQEIEADQKEKQMAYIPSFERMAAEEGEARGRAEGLKDGIALALKLKFGGAGQTLVAELRRINDIDTLRRVANAIENATGIEDVRQIWLAHS